MSDTPPTIDPTNGSMRSAPDDAPITAAPATCTTALAWTEAERLAALDRYAILDTGQEPAFDDLAALAADILDAPIAVVNLIAADRQWFKAEVGIGTDTLPLDVSICRHAILQSGMLVIPDLACDPRFDDNPLVHAIDGLRFYAGALIVTPDDLPLGTVCVLDTKPRPEGISERQERALRVLAAQTMARLELRRSEAIATVERARAEKHADRLSLIAKASSMLLTANDPTRAVRDLFELIADRFRVDVAFQYRCGDGILQLVAAAGLTPEQERAADRIEIGQTICGIVAATRQPAHVTGILASPDQTLAFLQMLGVDTYFSAPLVSSGELLGTISFGRSGEPFSPGERETLLTLVAQLAIALERQQADVDLRSLNADLERQVIERTQARGRNWAVSPDLMGALNADGYFETSNPAWHTMLGWSEAEVRRMSIWDFLHPDDIEGTRHGFDLNMVGEPAVDFLNRYRAKDGTYRWISWVGVPEDKLIYCTGRDVTEQRAQAEALAERTAERDRMWETSPDLMLVIDFDGIFRRVNPAWTTLLGYTADDLVGHHVTEFVLADDHGRTVRGYETAATGGQPRLENRYRHKDGSVRWISWAAAPAGDMTYASGRDVTAQRAVEARLRDEQDFARLALTAVGGVGVWTYDIVADRFVCDAAIAKLYGLDPEQAAAGLPRAGFLANVHPHDRKSLHDVMQGGLVPPGEVESEYRLVGPEGSIRWVLSRGLTYFDEDGRPLRRTGVGVDMTSQRQVEDQLRQAQKMEAVGQLTGGLAHDFNNLLTGMMGNMELLQSRLARGRVEDLDRFVIAAQGAGRRAASLTQRLLAFSRRQTLDPKPTDVNRLIAGMEDLLRRTVGPLNTIEVVGAAGLWTANIDAGQLENALLNLCLNGRDAMPEGGRLTIETANRWLDERAARERDLTPGQYLSICVTDTGTGMTPETIQRAFEPFFTTKPLGEGTGLGLSMIYGFARQSNGQVRIYSEIGSGTTICIYIPRYSGDALLLEEEQAVAIAAAATGATILVVDDEPTIRHLIDEVLDELGYTVIGAADGGAGLKVLQSSARIDLLVTDVGLPDGMNGRQVADAGRLLRPGLKVLFITGYAENAAVGNGHLEPGMALLTKPFTMEALAGKVADMMKG